MTTALARLALTLSRAIGLPPAAGAQTNDKMADKDMKMDHGQGGLAGRDGDARDEAPRRALA